MITPQNIDLRTATSTVGAVTTIIAILDHVGPPQRTFFFSAQVPPNSDEGSNRNIERRCLTQTLDQFLIWVQNGKP